MNLQFYRKLPIPMEIKKQFPISKELAQKREKYIDEMKDILAGKSNKFLLIVGPCSADNPDAVVEYCNKLREVQEKVKEKIFLCPRVYTNKPRTTGDGYKGMLHQPDPNSAPDMLKGIVAIRKLHTRVLSDTEMAPADEMLYPENQRYLSDILGYVAVGARSVEDQQHRLVASGTDVPVGMKNPTGGDLSVMMNSIYAGQHSHTFLYRGWEVKSSGNPYTHAILRGYMNKHEQSLPNYHYEDLMSVYEKYQASSLQNQAVIIDTNHANSGKRYLEQVRIAKEIVNSKKNSKEINSLVKGLMIESYLEDGNQPIGVNEVYGKSITDACLGFEKTQRLIYDLADIL